MRLILTALLMASSREKWNYWQQNWTKSTGYNLSLCIIFIHACPCSINLLVRKEGIRFSTLVQGAIRVQAPNSKVAYYRADSNVLLLTSRRSACSLHDRPRCRRPSSGSPDWRANIYESWAHCSEGILRDGKFDSLSCVYM